MPRYCGSTRGKSPDRWILYPTFVPGAHLACVSSSSSSSGAARKFASARLRARKAAHPDSLCCRRKIASASFCRRLFAPTPAREKDCLLSLARTKCGKKTSSNATGRGRGRVPISRERLFLSEVFYRLPLSIIFLFMTFALSLEPSRAQGEGRGKPRLNCLRWQ